MVLAPRCRHHAPATGHFRIAKGGRIVKATAEEKAQIDALLARQDGISRDVRQSFLDNIDRLGAQIDVDQITSLLQQGRVDQALSTVNDALTMSSFAGLGAAITQGAMMAGIAASNYSPDLGSLDVSFGVTNPATVDALRSYEFDLIRGLTSDARASVATAIRDGVANGMNPIDIARGLRDFIGLTPRQTQAVLNFEDALRSGSSAALDRALRDRRFDSTVQRAIDGEKDLSDDQIANMVGRYRDRYVKYRSETIGRTEGMRALNRGNQEAWKQAVSSGKVGSNSVRRYWWHSHDALVREAHLGIPDLNPDGVGLDEPFDSELGPIMYPGDPAADPANTINCRCTVIHQIEGGDEDQGAASGGLLSSLFG
jgi:hypothetical protein